MKVKEIEDRRNYLPAWEGSLPRLFGGEVDTLARTKDLPRFFEEEVDIHFQPILNLSTRVVYGFEALSRIRGAALGPAEFFRLMEREGKIFEADTLARVKAMRKGFAEGIFKNKKRLFLNVDPHVLTSFDYQKGVTVRTLREMEISPRNIVIEITEKTVAEDLELFKRALSHYKKQGFLIAIDDFGMGTAGLKALYDLRPHFVKMDMYFIRNIHRDNVKRKIVHGIVNTCIALGIETIAEGIKKEEEFSAVISLGFDYAQGFFISRPSPQPTFHLNLPADSVLDSSSDDVCLKELITHNASINLNDKVPEVIKLFTDEKLLILPVVNEGKPLGVLRRKDIDALLRTPFGSALLAYKKVREIMLSEFIEVEGEKRIENIAPFIEESSPDEKVLVDGIVVVEKGEYIGVANFYDLFRLLSQRVTQLSLDLNPLTKLPGNKLIRTWLEKITPSIPFCVAYIDFDNFKPFNDHNGFFKGDEAIVMMVEELKKVKRHLPGTKAGHIGGDDFILLYLGEEREEFIVEIEGTIKNFYEKRNLLFDAESLKKGFYRARDRRGKEKRFPLLAVSVGITTNKNFGDEINYLILNDRLQEVKAAAKASTETVFVDRREGSA